jgi:hypothetical protein
MIDCFERKTHKIRFGPTQVKRVWGIRNIVEINTSYDNVLLSPFLRQRRLRWTTHVVKTADSLIA